MLFFFTDFSLWKVIKSIKLIKYFVIHTPSLKLSNLLTSFFCLCLIFTSTSYNIIPTQLAAQTQQRQIPTAKYQVFTFGDFDMYLYAREFSQGETIYIKIIDRANNYQEFSLFFESKKYLLFRNTPPNKRSIFFDAIIPVAVDSKLGQRKIQIKAIVKGGEIINRNIAINISKTPFVQKPASLTVSKQYTTKPDAKRLNRIATERSKKTQAWQRTTPRQWQGFFLDPLNLAPITSEFYSRRIYNGKPGWPHSGVDLYGKWGDPVRAMNHGTIVLAQNFFYEGMIVIIDHGEDIYSLYQHLSKINIDEGQSIRKGELLGYVGSTGISTGSHLHLTVKINGMLICPLSLIALPI